MDKMHRWLGHFLVLLIVLMTLDVLWGVLTRYIIGSQSSWTEELARFLLIWIGILGAAYASGERKHLSINLLESSLKKDQSKYLNSFINTVILLFAIGVMIVGGSRLIYITGILGQSSAALNIPMTIVYSVIPLSGVIIVVYKIRELLRWR